MHRKLGIAVILAAIAIIGLAPSAAHAQPGRGPHRPVFIGGYFYDPFFGPWPWWTPGTYGYPYYPAYDPRTSEVRFNVTPKDAQVFVDGYYAGIVDDFDGAFGSLPLTPGGHDITLFLEGFKTIHQKVYLPPSRDFKLKYTMERLPAGERSEPVPEAPPVPAPPAGTATPPRTPPSSGAPITGVPQGANNDISSSGPMVVQKSTTTGSIVPEYKVSKFSGVTSQFAGAHGGVYVKKDVLVGAGLYTMTNGDQGRGMTYGGGLVSWDALKGGGVGLNLRALIGAGSGTTLETVSVPLRNGTSFDRTVRASSDFFLVEPGADVTFRISKSLGLGIGAGYRLTSRDREFDSNRFSGATGSITLKIG